MLESGAFCNERLFLRYVLTDRQACEGMNFFSAPGPVALGNFSCNLSGSFTT